ncbi:Phytoene desaturase, pro-zeta-carotene producing [Candidatus Nitrotoga sp. HW29]|uniref:hydroxysqualene dehydroxylase HpnE n=1 Tax=Candidatus Nitrotoga sp. HW29 TaxID=2886963 RepID=UPI001EF169E3|nr:hydroxysqualene dehydroxylase HpnE [Candidatus Nitrotoga sp. HW29]CAH1905880.1 Phytoene desaturase, pro-zeta-carotene producing [Candidatus Nitrotoga sp. HW29]
MSNNKNHHVAIIGGGYAGMAAAVTLAAANVPVTVFESAKQLGGRARGVWHNDVQLDNGQHILLGCYHHTLQLIEQVGGSIEHDFLRLPLQLTLHNRFELKTPHLPAPLHLLAGLLNAKGLSLGERLRAARFMLALGRINFTLPRDISVLEVLRIHDQGDELIRLLWEPLCISALNTPIHIASAQVLLHVLRDSLNGLRSDSDMLLPRIDFTALFPKRAAQYVKQLNGTVRTACSVEAIIPNGNKIELITHPTTIASTHTQLFSHVICAITPIAAARLFRTVPQLALIAEQIAAIPHQPIYTVYLQYPEQMRLPQPMLGLDRCFTQWLFDKGQIAGQHGLIAAVISAQGKHQNLKHELLAQTVAQEISKQLGIREAPLWHQVIAEKRATFSCETNLPRPAHVTPLANVLLAGDYTAGDYPATLEGAVMSGILCAKTIASTFQ